MRITMRGIALVSSAMLAVAALSRTTYAQARGSVGGIVYDSMQHRPVAGATVQLLSSPVADTSYIATTDASGAFKIDSVKPGHYLAGFFHPTLDSLGLNSPLRAVDVAAGSSATTSLWVPSATGITRAVCGTAGLPADSSALLLGHVRDAETGEPIPGSTVVVVWYELIIDRGMRRERRQVPVKTDQRGWYAICRLPIDAGLSARAERGSDVTGFVDVTPTAGAIDIEDFAIPRSDSAGRPSTTVVNGMRKGSARLAGTVKNKAGRPIAGAQVRVIETAANATTADNGTFTLAGLPSGTQSVEVRSIGFAPKRAAVRLSSRTPAVVELVMSERIAELDAVTVYGQANERRNRALSGFLERRKSGFGNFLTHEEIEKYQPLSFCDVLHRVPGVSVSYGGGGMSAGSLGGCSIMMRGTETIMGSCSPTFFLDGARMIGGASDMEMAVRPEEIAGVEVYKGAATTPAEFTGGCGAVVVWTGRR
ncbi:MAG: carboxypeptidase regulatory-like domain-containing protein [Gemmatimonadota bacterium]|nr:carboxypeptidase regulatory-like domain-containing protein [Gemmatimonadota bacterium]